jgi:hypothetical protein
MEGHLNGPEKVKGRVSCLRKMVLCLRASSTLPACLCLESWGGFLGLVLGWAWSCIRWVTCCSRLLNQLDNFVHARTACALYRTQLLIKVTGVFESPVAELVACCCHRACPTGNVYQQQAQRSPVASCLCDRDCDCFDSLFAIIVAMQWASQLQSSVLSALSG